MRLADTYSEVSQTDRSLPRYLLPIWLICSALIATIGATLFTATEAVPGLPSPDVAVEFGLPIIRALLDIAAVATVGLSLLPKLLGFKQPERTEPIMRGARVAAVATALTWVLCALVATALQAAEVNPGANLTLGQVVTYVQNVTAGQGLMLSALCAFIYAAIGFWAVRVGESVPAELRILIALFGLVPMPVTGHATNWQFHDFSMISMELHVIFAALWTGGLFIIALLLVAHQDLLAIALPSFSKLATVCLFTVGATGIFNGVVVLIVTPGSHFPSALITTHYGNLILIKAVLTLILVVLGANIRFRLLPAIRQRQPSALLGWAGLELAVMGLTYGIAVVLTRAPITS